MSKTHSISKNPAMLALNILAALLIGYQYIFILVQVWQLNSKVLINIAWYSQINTCISYCPKYISLHIAVIPNIL